MTGGRSSPTFARCNSARTLASTTFRPRNDRTWRPPRDERARRPCPSRKVWVASRVRADPEDRLESRCCRRRDERGNLDFRQRALRSVVSSRLPLLARHLGELLGRRPAAPPGRWTLGVCDSPPGRGRSEEPPLADTSVHSDRLEPP